MFILKVNWLTVIDYEYDAAKGAKRTEGHSKGYRSSKRKPLKAYRYNNHDKYPNIINSTI